MLNYIKGIVHESSTAIKQKVLNKHIDIEDLPVRGHLGIVYLFMFNIKKVIV
jgi:hypothetical protein